MYEAHQLKTNHRPFHFYDGHTYFLTGRCYKALHYFESTERKQLFISVLKAATERFNVKLFAWALLHNHYHIMFWLPPEKQNSPIDKTDFAVAQSVTPSVTNNIIRSNEMSQANFVQNTENQKFRIIEFVRKLHKDTARIINNIDHAEGRQIWYQYWDYCIRNQTDFWKHFNYIIQQPLKHGLVKTLAEAYRYPHSSNPTWLKRFGEAGLSEGFIKYPMKDWTPANGAE